jgi:hypothetical protein
VFARNHSRDAIFEVFTQLVRFVVAYLSTSYI